MSLINELGDLFGEVEKLDGVFEQLPDGEYLGTIESAEYKESKKGTPMVMLGMKVIHGEHEGEFHNKFWMLAGDSEMRTKQNLNQFAVQIRQLGVETSDGLQSTLDSLESILGETVVFKLETTKSKKTGKEFTNTSVRLAD